MPINNFDFPSVSFSAVFQSDTVGSRANLGACCIGPAYKLHRYEDNTALLLNGKLSVAGGGTGDYNPDGGASDNQLDLVDVSNHIVRKANLDFTKSTHKLVVKNGVWRYKTISTGVEEEKDSTDNRTGYLRFRDASVRPIIAGTPPGVYDRGVRVGDPIRLVTANGVFTTVVMKVDKSSSSSYEYNRIQVARGSMPVDDDGQDLSVIGVELCVYANRTFVSEGTSSALNIDDAGVLKIKSGITTTLEMFVEVDAPALTGELMGGDLYLEFRERDLSNKNTRMVFSSQSEIAAELGTPCADNPLALSCLFALNGANGRMIYCVPVGDETVAGYELAVSALDKYNDIYSIIPCTKDASIISQVVEHCKQVSTGSESKIRRSCWYGIDLDDKPIVFRGEAVFKEATNGSLATAIILNNAVYTHDSTQDVEATDDAQARYAWVGPTASITVSGTSYAYDVDSSSGDDYTGWKNGSDILYTATRSPETGDKAYSDTALSAGEVTIASVAAGTVWTTDRSPRLGSKFYAAGTGDTEISWTVNTVTLVGYRSAAPARFQVVTKTPFQTLTDIEDHKLYVSTDYGTKIFDISYTDDISTAYLGSTAVTTGLVDGNTYTMYIVNDNASGADYIQSLISMRTERSNSERAQCVWADEAWYNGEVVPNMALAAAAAGMRSYEQPHRPLSNLGYAFFTISDKHNFMYNDLIEIGSNGIWIIDNNTDGTPINKHQITTAVANDLNKDEESVIADIDTIAVNLINVGQSVVGNSNINDSLLGIIEMDIRNRLSGYLSENGAGAYTGPQLLEYTILEIYQDSVTRDKIYASIELVPPHPFNKLIMNVQVK